MYKEIIYCNNQKSKSLFFINYINIQHSVQKRQLAWQSCILQNEMTLYTCQINMMSIIIIVYDPHILYLFNGTYIRSLYEFKMTIGTYKNNVNLFILVLIECD